MSTHKRSMHNDVPHTADDLRDKAAGVRQSVEELGTAARDAAQQAASQLRDTAAEKTSDFRDAAVDRIGEARRVAEDYYLAGREQAIDWEQSIEDRIRERPLQSMMIAAGVGMLAGIIFMRR